MADTYYAKEAVTKTLIEYFQCSHISESFIKAVVEQIPAAYVRPVKIGHYVTDDMGDSSCSECGEKYLDITKRFCPECGAKLRRNDGDQ